MKPYRLWPYQTLIVLFVFAWAVFLWQDSAASVTAVDSLDHLQLPSQYQFSPVQRKECSQRRGPFVTQSTAQQRREEAQKQGYGVSGIFPCYESWTRGYCFNVFFAC